MALNSYGQSDWQCALSEEGDIDGPGPGVWIRATSAKRAAFLFRHDLAGRKAGTIVVSDNKGREVLRVPWPGSIPK